MYDLFAYISPKFTVNEGKYAYISAKFMVNEGTYTIHGACGKDFIQPMFLPNKNRGGRETCRRSRRSDERKLLGENGFSGN